MYLVDFRDFLKPQSVYFLRFLSFPIVSLYLLSSLLCLNERPSSLDSLSLATSHGVRFS